MVLAMDHFDWTLADWNESSEFLNNFPKFSIQPLLSMHAAYFGHHLWQFPPVFDDNIDIMVSNRE